MVYLYDLRQIVIKAQPIQLIEHIKDRIVSMQFMIEDDSHFLMSEEQSGVNCVVKF